LLHEIQKNLREDLEQHSDLDAQSDSGDAP